MDGFGNIAEAHSTGAVSAETLFGRLAEIDALLDELKNDDVPPERRRNVARRVSAAARGFAQSIVVRSDATERLQRLADQLECMPTSMQRFDHQVSKLEWALRRLGNVQMEMVQEESELALTRPANDDAVVADAAQSSRGQVA